MKPIDFVHLTLLALGGKISGKTNLQKKVYFLGLLTGKLEELGYRPHYYGPYSESVATAVEDLKTVGFVDQNVTSTFGIDDMGFERRRYDYTLTPDGLQLAKAKKNELPEDWNKLEEAVRVLNRAGERDYMKLSIAAKTYFLLGQEKKATTQDELARLAPRFGWRVSREEIVQAAEYLKALGLIVTERN
ncbi:MAG: hypothetical protein L6Q92_14325 [Phycisphaerae bacterium]|nr:hypothetical protein [Phycisphaerae bacterium]